MLGAAAVAMWWHVAPEHRAEWEDWHSGEHMHERLAIPGFLRGSRWTNGEGAYFVLYEAESLATLTSGPYMERLNNPTPMSRKMMPRHLDMVRSLCLVRESYGDGLPGVMGTLRFSGSAPLPKARGITSAALLQSQPMPGAQTMEQKIRGGDRSADTVLLVGGYDVDAVRAVAPEVYRLAYCLS